MINFPSLLRRGIRLPPSGWVLAAMLAFYVVAGLFGRDPWKGEDAIHIGAAWDMLNGGHWLAPTLAGRAFHEPPLYYWSAALTGLLFDWALPAHDAMRLASGLWVTCALVGLYYAGRELYGQDHAAASPLLLAGCTGLLFHAHDAQPILIALAAYAGALGALAALPRKPRMAAVFLGLAMGGCLLGAGIAPTLPLLAILPVALMLADERRQALRAILLALLTATAIVLPWLAGLYQFENARFWSWLDMELRPLQTDFSFTGLLRFGAMLPTFAFPALPLAAWTLWRRRQQWLDRSQLLPLAFLLITLLLLAWAYRPREIPALLLLPSVALLATPGALSLRRGAANAFDWFAVCAFSVLGLLVWLCWSAMALGIPEQLAGRVVALRPGFVGSIDWTGLAIGLGATLWWIWLIVTAPRSPYRSLTHWTLGCTTFWLMATALILPWFDYGKSYRPVAEAIATALPAGHLCLAERALNDAQRASLAYFVGIRPLAYGSAAGKQCDWLVSGSAMSADSGWRLVWEGSRPGERREKLRLYQR